MEQLLWRITKATIKLDFVLCYGIAAISWFNHLPPPTPVAEQVQLIRQIMPAVCEAVSNTAILAIIITNGRSNVIQTPSSPTVVKSYPDGRTR